MDSIFELSATHLNNPLPPNCTAPVPLGWTQKVPSPTRGNPHIKRVVCEIDWCVIRDWVERFGVSTPGPVVMHEYGFNIEDVALLKGV